MGRRFHGYLLKDLVCLQRLVVCKSLNKERVLQKILKELREVNNKDFGDGVCLLLPLSLIYQCLSDVLVCLNFRSFNYADISNVTAFPT